MKDAKISIFIVIRIEKRASFIRRFTLIPNPDKPEPNRFEDKKIDCVSEFSARKKASFRTRKLKRMPKN